MHQQRLVRGVFGCTSSSGSCGQARLLPSACQLRYVARGCHLCGGGVGGELVALFCLTHGCGGITLRRFCLWVYSVQGGKRRRHHQ